MALPSYYTPVQPYRAPQAAGGQQVQNQLYAALAAGNTAAAGAPPRLPYGEFGANTSAPARVGDTGATSPFSATRGNLGDQSQPAPAASDSSKSTNNSGGSMPGFEDDPILARTKAMWARNVSQAEAAALAGRKQAEIGYGYDPNYTYADQSTQQAAQQNAFSDLASLLYNHTERSHQTDEGLNKGNLFYSGERAHQLGREGRQYTLEQTQANQGFQSKLAAIGNALLQTRLQAQDAQLAAEENAYNRALQFDLQYGIGPGGGDGGGGGGAASQQNWGGYALPAGAKSFAGAGQQASPNIATFTGAEGNPQPSWGNWGGQGPGQYMAVKYPGANGFSDTRWVKVG